MCGAESGLLQSCMCVYRYVRVDRYYLSNRSISCEIDGGVHLERYSIRCNNPHFDLIFVQNLQINNNSMVYLQQQATPASKSMHRFIREKGGRSPACCTRDRHSGALYYQRRLEAQSSKRTRSCTRQFHIFGGVARAFLDLFFVRARCSLRLCYWHSPTQAAAMMAVADSMPTVVTVPKTLHSMTGGS